MTTDAEKLACAVEFEILPEWYPAYGRVTGGIHIVQRGQRDGGEKWAVTWSHNTLTKAGNWEYERQPSSRTEAYLKRSRFDTLDEAWSAAVKAGRKMYRAACREYPGHPIQDMRARVFELPAWVAAPRRLTRPH